MNKVQLSNALTEIVAMRLDAYAQHEECVYPLDTDSNRWRERYKGIPKEALPPYTIEINKFKNEVDNFVAHLMTIVDHHDDD